jgi:hypothetical protein
MTRIALSYRQSDIDYNAGRLLDILNVRYKNVAAIRPGDLSLATSVHDYIEQQLDACYILVAIIGSDWVGKKRDGTWRIDQPADYVRLGLQTALERGIPVIPVLVEGTELPLAEDLPGDLQDFDRYPPISLDVQHGFGKSAGQIGGYIDEIVSSRKQSVLRPVTLKDRLHWRPRLPNLNVSRFLRWPKTTRKLKRRLDKPERQPIVTLRAARFLIVNVIGAALVASGAVLNSAYAEVTMDQFGNLLVGLGALMFLTCNSYYSMRLLFAQKSTA